MAETNSNKTQYTDVIIAYEGDGDYGKYIKLTILKDVSFKEGDKIYLNFNKFKNGNPAAPDYKYSVKNSDGEPKVKPAEKQDELPF